MRLGLHVMWDSLKPGSKHVFTGTVHCFEHDPAGWAIVARDGFPDERLPIGRARLRVAQPPAKKTAKGGGDDSAPAGVLMAEVA